MNVIVRIGFVVSVFFAGGLAVSQEKEFDPFDPDHWKEEEAIEAAPETWEVMCEAFSMPFDEAVKLRRKLKGAEKIYAELIQRVEGKTAVLEEFAVLKGRVDAKSKMESVEEYIYPTEFDPPETLSRIKKMPKNEDLAGMLMTPSTPTSFETKNIGVTMEVEVNEKRAANAISVDLNFVLVTLVDRDLWGKGKAETAMPRFHVQGLEKEMILKSGRPVLVGSMSPPKQGDRDGRRVWFLYVTNRAGEK